MKGSALLPAAAAAAAAGLLLLQLATADESPPPAPPPTVSVTAPAGSFNGFLENGTKKWLGVPYAEPPVEELRWMPTVPKGKLPDPIDTKKYAPDCAQIGPGWPSLSPESMDKNCHNFMKGCPNMTWSATNSEDCLYLNIYAPASSTDPEQGFPVVVYYPSGAFEWGAANDQESNAFGHSTAPGWRNSVLVTVNYRTGIFGFLTSKVCQQPPQTTVQLAKTLEVKLQMAGPFHDECLLPTGSLRSVGRLFRPLRHPRPDHGPQVGAAPKR